MRICIFPKKTDGQQQVHEKVLSQYQSSPAAAAKSLQSCPTLCDPIDSSPPDSSVPGILHARTLEWAAISSEKYKSKSKVTYHLTSVRMTIIKKNPRSKFHRCGKKGTLCIVGRNVNWYSHYGEQYEGFSRN